MELDVYATIFEHFPPTRNVSHAPQLFFASSTWTLSALKRQVDLVASALLSSADLDVAGAVSQARQSKGQWPRAIILAKEQEVAEYSIALLACFKVGLQVILVDGSRLRDAEYIDHLLRRMQPQVMFVDEAVSPAFYLPRCTFSLDEAANKSRAPYSSLIGQDFLSLASLAEGQYSRLDMQREAHLRQELARVGVHSQPGVMTLEDDHGVRTLYHASQASLVAGIRAFRSLISQSGLESWPTLTFCSALPLHVASNLTLCLFAPLALTIPTSIYAPHCDIGDLLSVRSRQHLWLADYQAVHLLKRLQSHKERTALPASLAILQPGAGIKVLDALASLMPATRLFNTYVPRLSTAPFFLAPYSPAGLLLGLAVGLHRLAVADRKTGSFLPLDHEGDLFVQGAAMMANLDKPANLNDFLDVGESGVIHSDNSLELTRGSALQDPCAYLQDHILAHPQVKDCCAMLVGKQTLCVFVSALDSDCVPEFAQMVSSWAAQGHSYFTEANGKITLVSHIPRSYTGTVESEKLLQMETAISSMLAPPAAAKSTLKIEQKAPKSAALSKGASTSRRLKTAVSAHAKSSTKSANAAPVVASTGLASTPSASTNASASGKKPGRDSKRRATHSQIERRRREKINDRLVMLRSIVPACAAEVEERKRQKREEEEEARRIAAGELVSSTSAKGKRKRNRRKPAKPATEGEKEEELGLHKLEVLTHTIDYIYELQDRIYELETGTKPASRSKGDRDEEDVKEEKEAQVMAEDGDEEDEDNGGNNDDDDDEGSDANLEMAEWRPSVKRRTSEVGLMHAADFTSRRSTISSEYSSLATSPAVMSLSAESPMFSAAASSSTSAFTSLTSPMMSLSSESPILRWGNNNITPPRGSSREQDSGDSMLAARRKHAWSHSGQNGEWQLPAPALSIDESAKAKPAVHLRNGTLNGHDTTKSVRPLSSSSSSAQEAHLLLNLGTSPEVLRPVSAVRQTSFVTPMPTLQRGQSVTMSQSDISSQREERWQRARGAGNSAPGGAHPSNSGSGVLLVSPPLLALDAPSSAPLSAESTSDAKKVNDHLALATTSPEQDSTEDHVMTLDS